jgi:hypothetical protein
MKHPHNILRTPLGNADIVNAPPPRRTPQQHNQAIREALAKIQAEIESPDISRERRAALQRRASRLVAVRRAETSAAKPAT